MQKALNGAIVRKIFIAGYNILEKNKAYVDSLNVFPVPDGDTGTNMTLTMRSVVKELEACPANDLPALGEAIARGGLRGARGNSGVILSQILKGMTAEFKQTKDGNLTTKAFARAMDEGARVAYQAVTVPKEGTILTVIRIMAAAAKSIAKHESGFENFFTAVITKGEEILAQTPEMLPVLKKAGVVDAGGRGLIIVFNGFLKALLGDPDVDLVFQNDGAPVVGGESADDHSVFEDLSEIEFAYCTEFMITNMSKVTTMASIDALREKLMTMGDSVICVGDLNLVKVHVHTNTPGVALTEALNLGEIINMKIENMLQQNRELRASRNVPEKAQGLVAVAAGAGIIGIFKDLGVDYVIKGGQTMNPSAEDIASAAAKVHAKTVFIFPNNKNIILAAKHAQSLVDKNLIVIPTRSINEGITACISYNPEATTEENTDAFLSAMETVKSGSVTYAVRNTQLGRFDIKEGEVLGLDNKTILTKGKAVADTTLKLIEKLITDSTVNITLFFGEDIKEKEAYQLQDKLAAKYPKCEVNMVSGGQPVYYYLISME
jgi:DAK2 domain fusion protein YloV